MAFAPYIVQVTDVTQDTVEIQIGPEGYTFTKDQIMGFFRGDNRPAEIILYMVALKCFQANRDPSQITKQQFINIVDGMTINW